jgi:hypothetical protein
MGIIAFIVIIGFSMITCDDSGGDDNGGSSGATLGQETLTITNQQVYTMVLNGTNYTISYPIYTGSLTLSDGYTPPLGTAVISGGKFTYTQSGAPTGSALIYISNIFSDDATVSPNDAKCAVIDGFDTDIGYLGRANYSISNYNANTQTGTATQEQVVYIYVDKNVAIKAEKSGPIEDADGEYTYNAINLSLTKGWNAVTQKSVETVTTSKIFRTYSVIKGDTGRWILDEDK